MGEAADDALDRMMDIDEIQTRLYDVDPTHLDDYERELMMDYDGTLFPTVFSKRSLSPVMKKGKSKKDNRVRPPNSYHVINVKETVTFGKHKGEKWDNLPTSYLIWASTNVDAWKDHAKKVLYDRGYDPYRDRTETTTAKPNENTKRFLGTYYPGKPDRPIRGIYKLFPDGKIVLEKCEYIETPVDMREGEFKMIPIDEKPEGLTIHDQGNTGSSVGCSMATLQEMEQRLGRGQVCVQDNTDSEAPF